MATRTVFVSRRGKSKNLKLRDSEGHNPGNDKITTMVNPGDTIIWMLDPIGNNLYSLNGIERKASSPANLLKSNPVEQPNGTYKGVVKNDPKLKGKTESYFIKYRLTKNGQIREDDPKIKMNT